MRNISNDSVEALKGNLRLVFSLFVSKARMRLNVTFSEILGLMGS